MTGTIGSLDTADTEEAMARTPEELERAARAGEWLRPGDAAILLGVSRSTVVRMIETEPPEMRYRVKIGTGRHREIHPEDLLAIFATRDVVHGES